MEPSVNESEALEVILDANADRPHGEALSEEELVRLVIRFVNAPSLLDFCRLLARDRGTLLKPSANTRNAAIADAAVIEETKAECEQTRTELQALIDHAVSPMALARLTASASRQALLPVFDLNGAGLRIRYRYRPSNLAAVLDHATLLLLDPALPFGKDLHRCRLETCSAFFLAVRSTGGRPRTEYCSKAHMTEHHDATAADRKKTPKTRRSAKHK